ncbi:unnamed protein product [Meloidogyne enterolobii]|uniref:Uncharacterized protein n=1 Tax=Meloidogyne enterolobii TaxID=390850 RepID=A0ACB0ZNC7_MELEN
MNSTSLIIAWGLIRPTFQFFLSRVTSNSFRAKISYPTLHSKLAIKTLSPN